jgi:protein-disulfide isomerase
MPEEPQTQKKFEITPSIAVLFSGVLIAGAIIFVNLNPTPAPTLEGSNLPTSVDVRPASSNEHIMGSPNAKIILIEYSDFQCPYCSRVHPTLKRFVDEGEGDVAWVYRHLPLESIHPEARPAALASECIAEQLGNDGFWAFADRVFANQGKMNTAYYTQLAAELGADSVAFAGCLSSEKYAEKIDQDTLEAEQNGASGTPFTVVVGDALQVPVSGALPYAQFASVIKAVKERL